MIPVIHIVQVMRCIEAKEYEDSQDHIILTGIDTVHLEAVSSVHEKSFVLYS